MDVTLTPRHDGDYPDTPDSAVLGRNQRPAHPLQGVGTMIITKMNIYLPDRVEGSYPG